MKVVLPDVATIQFHNLFYGGLKHTHYLARFLHQEGADVEIVSAQNQGSTLKSQEVDGIKYTFLRPMTEWHKPRIVWKWLFSFNLAFYLRKQKDFDIVHSHDMLSYGYLRLDHRKPAVMQPFAVEPFRNEETLVHKGFKGFLIDISLRHPWKYCLLKSEAVATDGDFVVDDLIKLGVPKEKLFFSPSGVDTEKINESIEKTSKTRKDIGLGENDFVLIAVNQLAEGKRVLDIIDALNILSKKIENIKLIMIGAGPLEEEIHKQITSYNLDKSVIHLKNVKEEELYAYFKMADVYISAATGQDILISTMEALACGLPIAATFQKMFIEEKKNGYLIPTKNPQAIADAVLKIHDKGNLQAMGEISKKIIKDYDWRIIAKNALKKYDELI